MSPKSSKHIYRFLCSRKFYKENSFGVYQTIGTGTRKKKTKKPGIESSRDNKPLHSDNHESHFHHIKQT
jgi:hypothetical protein